MWFGRSRLLELCVAMSDLSTIKTSFATLAQTTATALFHPNSASLTFWRATVSTIELIFRNFHVAERCAAPEERTRSSASASDTSTYLHFPTTTPFLVPATLVPPCDIFWRHCCKVSRYLLVLLRRRLVRRNAHSPHSTARRPSAAPITTTATTTSTLQTRSY